MHTTLAYPSGRSNLLSFKDFIFKEKLVSILTIILVFLIEFFVFKFFYPFPSFFHDSYWYIYAAHYHLNVNIWPIGYSWFLGIFHSLTSSPFALVCFQFFFYLFSALYFYLTVIYFYRVSRFTRILLTLFFFFDPLFLYMGNYITSDILFLSMSLIWFAQLIWALRKPKIYQLFIQAGLLFILFTFRYNAMVYPLIAIMVYILSRQTWDFKLVGLLLGPVLISCFILFSRNAAKHMTGEAQFPPILGGWQWANNALYMREFIRVDSSEFPNSEVAALDKDAQAFFKNTPSAQRDLYGSQVNFFVCAQDAPLQQYVEKTYHPRAPLSVIVDWGRCAGLFDQYGKTLIKHHPMPFFQHYILLNVGKYFQPPLEQLYWYNFNQPTIWPVAQYWFHASSPRVGAVSYTVQGKIIAPMNTFYLLLNILCPLGLVIFLAGRSYRKAGADLNRIIAILALFLGLNFAFSVFAGVIVFRYQLFPLVLLLTCTLLVFEHLATEEQYFAYFSRYFPFYARKRKTSPR